MTGKRLTVSLLTLCGAVLAGFAAGWVYLQVTRDATVEDTPRPDVAPREEPPAVAPVFTDVTGRAGIRARHETGATGRFYYPEVMGGGCAFVDYDGDGFLDLYLVNGNRLPPAAPDPAIGNVLLRNNRDGTFTDVTAKAGVGDPSYGQGVGTADYDGDGDQDIYVTNFGPDVLYRNRGDGTFEVVAHAEDGGWGQSAAFFDADGDGALDLYVQNYLVYSLENDRDWYVTIGGERVLDYCSPSGYEGQQDRLFLNSGGGVFKDVTAESGILVEGKTGPEGTGMGLVCADFDGDGDADIFIANDSRSNFYYRNDGRGRFTECALEVGLAYNAEGGMEAFMGVDTGDYDGDGRLDIAVPSLRQQGFNLFRNLGSLFQDVSVSSGLVGATGSVTGFAPVFLDYDCDGDLDLFFANGDVRMGRTTAGRGASFEERYSMENKLLENREGRFVDVSSIAGPPFHEARISRSCAAGDYDNDGDTDLFVTTMGGEPVLLRNDTRGGGWIGFLLQAKAPNLDAVGAKLWLTAGGKTQFREVYAGGSYLGQRDRRQLFGLGSATRVERVVIRWPDGSETTVEDLPPKQYHTVRQGSPAPKSSE